MMRSFIALTAGLRHLLRAGAGRIIFIVTVFSVAAASTGCSRGYISAYSDNLSRNSCSMTAVSADFSGFTSLYAEDLAVPGEGGKAEAGDVFAAGLFDLQDGKTVVEENLTKRLYPASITKILTALLAVKYGDMDEMLTASARVPEMEWEAQKIGIEKGDRMTMEQALNYLLVYSANDKLVGKAAHFDVLKSALSHKENIRFLLVHNKGHNPNYTEDAVKYLGEYSSAVAKQRKKLKTADQKKAFRDSWDWNRMTAQDEAVWAEIFKTLDT